MKKETAEKIKQEITDMIKAEFMPGLSRGSHYVDYGRGPELIWEFEYGVDRVRAEETQEKILQKVGEIIDSAAYCPPPAGAGKKPA